MSLRKHMQEKHKRIKLKRNNSDIVKQHMEDHHRYSPDHTHGPTRAGTSAKDRPPGWTTGEDVRPIKK